MLVGPMKRKVITTGIVSALVPIIILGIIGFFIISNYGKQIAKLKEQQTNAERYVLANDVISNHVITEDDLKLAEVKEIYVPADSYSVYRNKNGSITSDDKYSLVGRRLKVSAMANTILTDSMLYEDDKAPTIDLRLQEFNMITLPSNLVENDYIDIRLRFPTGDDYSVLIAKRVLSYTENSILLKLTEDEILTIGSAIIEAYMTEGSKLYAIKYVDPANQLYEYKVIDYVARYASVAEEILRDKFMFENPEATEEAIAEYLQNADRSSINDDEIAIKIGLTVDETKELREAIKTQNKDILETYQNKKVVLEKQIVRTYPVKTNVLALISANPNILEEVKASFNTQELLAQRMAMATADLDTLLPEEKEEVLDRLKERVTEEIDAQKQERINYLKSLINE